MERLSVDSRSVEHGRSGRKGETTLLRMKENYWVESSMEETVSLKKTQRQSYTDESFMGSLID